MGGAPCAPHQAQHPPTPPWLPLSLLQVADAAAGAYRQGSQAVNRTLQVGLGGCGWGSPAVIIHKGMSFPCHEQPQNIELSWIAKAAVVEHKTKMLEGTCRTQKGRGPRGAARPSAPQNTEHRTEETDGPPPHRTSSCRSTPGC